MGIKQLNGTYIAAEDRILLRLSTDAGEEFRFWLTRPITGELLTAIHAIATRTIARKFSPEIAPTVAEFEQQAVKAQAKLDEEYQPGATLPLGEAPALVVKLTATEKSGDLSLDLALPNGQNVNVCLQSKLAQHFGVLLDKLQHGASWALAQPAAPAPAAQDSGATASDEKKLVH